MCIVSLIDTMLRCADIAPSITHTDLPSAIESLQRVFGFREREEARLNWPGGGMTLRLGTACLIFLPRMRLGTNGQIGRRHDR